MKMKIWDKYAKLKTEEVKCKKCGFYHLVFVRTNSRGQRYRLFTGCPNGCQG